MQIKSKYVKSRYFLTGLARQSLPPSKSRKTIAPSCLKECNFAVTFTHDCFAKETSCSKERIIGLNYRRGRLCAVGISWEIHFQSRADARASYIDAMGPSRLVERILIKQGSCVLNISLIYAK